MKKENKSEKVCPCGRIITDPNNKSGLCPKCMKTGAIGVGTLGVTGVGILAKKYGYKIIKGAFNVVKNIIKL